jgi:hypothetical protein
MRQLPSPAHACLDWLHHFSASIHYRHEAAHLQSAICESLVSIWCGQGWQPCTPALDPVRLRCGRHGPVGWPLCPRNAYTNTWAWYGTADCRRNATSSCSWVCSFAGLPGSWRRQACVQRRGCSNVIYVCASHVGSGAARSLYTDAIHPHRRLAMCCAGPAAAGYYMRYVFSTQPESYSSQRALPLPCLECSAGHCSCSSQLAPLHW